MTQVGPVLWELHRLPGGLHGDTHVHLLPAVPAMVRHCAFLGLSSWVKHTAWEACQEYFYHMPLCGVDCALCPDQSAPAMMRLRGFTVCLTIGQHSP